MKLREEAHIRDLEIVPIEGIFDGVGVHHEGKGQDGALRLRDVEAMDRPDTPDDLCFIHREEVITKEEY
jgi:hypothetical protein